MADQAEALRMNMELTDIPGTSLKVSPVAIGTWAIGGWMWGGTDEAESIATIRAAFEHGINIVDTAPVYGFGRSEEIVGKAIAEGRLRSDVLIATKAGLEWDGGKVSRNASRARILREVEDSLRRLRTDYIDIYQVHWPDPLVDDRRNRGSDARAVGAGEDPRHRREQFFGSPDGAVSPRCAAACAAAAIQSVRTRNRGRPSALLPQKQDCDAGIWRAVPRPAVRTDEGRYGFRWRRSAAHRPEISSSLGSHNIWPPCNKLDRLARERFGKRVIHLAVRWMLDQGITTALWGARHPDQLQPVDEVTGWSLDASAKAEIDRILRETITDPVGPEFMAPPARSARCVT